MKGWRLTPLLVSLAAPASGQAPSARTDEAVTTATPVDLLDVLRSARKHHPSIQSERAVLLASQAEQRAARGEFDTVLGAQGRAAVMGYYDYRRFDLTVEQPTPLLGASLYGGYRVTRGKVAPYYGEYYTLARGELRGGVKLPLAQDLLIDGRRAGVRAASAQARAAEQTLNDVLLDIEREAALAYFTWTAAGQRLRVLEELITLASTRDRELRSQVQLGSIPAVEQLDNTRSLLERERQLVAARRAFEKAAIDLSLYLRTEQGAPRLPAPAELPGTTPAVSAQPSSGATEARALAQRPERRAIEAQIEQARVDRALAQNRVLPRLDAYGEVSKDLGSPHSDLPPSIAPTLTPTALEVGVSLSLPLWLRRARGKLQAAEAKLRSVEAKARLTEDKIVAEVRDARSQFEAARERAALAERTVEAALQVAAGERERFQLGASTILVVNLREQSAADAQMAMIDALAELQYSAVRVLNVSGESLLTQPGARAEPP